MLPGMPRATARAVTGKAPEPMVEKRYAGQIDEELRKRLIPESYRETLGEQKLKVVG